MPDDMNHFEDADFSQDNDSNDEPSDDARFMPPGYSHEPDDAAQRFDVDDFAQDEVSIEDDNPYTAPSEESDPDAREALVALESLTLSDLVREFVRSPLRTWGLFSQILHDHSSPLISVPTGPQTRSLVETSETTDSRESIRRFPFSIEVGDRQKLRLGLYITAFLLAWWGNSILSSGSIRIESELLVGGAPFLAAGVLLWVIAELVGNWPALNEWWWRQDRVARAHLFARFLPVALIINGVIVLLQSTHMPEADVLSIAQRGFEFAVLGIFFWLLMDISVWLLGRAYHNNPSMFPTWVQEDIDARGKPKFGEDDAPEDTLEDDAETDWREPVPEPVTYDLMAFNPVGMLARTVTALVATFFSLLTWSYTTGNQFSDVQFLFIQINAIPIWIFSVILWALVFVPSDWNPIGGIRNAIQSVRQMPLQQMALIGIVFVVILVFAAAFRFSYLYGDPATQLVVPPEMTSDHVEKLLDSQRVLEGARDIFFSNNGGREPIQMYLMAMFSQLPGQSMTFESLKTLAGIESMLTLPVLVWLGLVVVGPENRRLGWILGLMIAAAVAVSYWDTVITRLSLRIILTPLVTSLLLIYLIRGMRYNRRGDFIMAGLVLGFGLYTYQAVRMLPVVVLAAVGIAIIATSSLRMRRDYILHLVVLVLISFVVFIPMFHFSTQAPEEFWRRTTGRLLGDDVVTEQMQDGTIVQRTPTVPERVEAFSRNIPAIMRNIRNALLMFNWKGDVGWINGAPNEPVLAPLTGAFFILGWAAWGIWMFKKRDASNWLVPVTLLIMLLPSALSIAYTLENPSHTRTSGALPSTYVLVAFPMALIFDSITRKSPADDDETEDTPAKNSLRLPEGMARYGFAFAFCGLVLIGAYSANTNTYFTKHYEAYLRPSLPYSEAGRVLQGFAISDGGFGNAFLLAYPYWWDYRAIGLEAGVTDWPNGIKDPDGDNNPGLPADQMPQILYDATFRTDIYRYDPDKDLLFFLAVEDEPQLIRLQDLFPEGRSQVYPSYQENDNFLLYRVPAFGWAGFDEFLKRHGVLDPQ